MSVRRFGGGYRVPVAGSHLAEELRRHMTDPFPESVQTGEDYGEVNSVLIGADIYGWALNVSKGGTLSVEDRTRLQRAAAELERSLQTFPDEARLYYERVLQIARLALAES